LKVVGKTKIVGIFGYPVKHTLSPIMHNAAFTALDIPYLYLPFEVKPENLKEALFAIRALDLAGVNLTIPHKVEAIKYLDEVTREVKLIGSTNTIQHKDGKLIGHNTDGKGFVTSLKEDLGFDPRGKNVLLLGAGGAGRAILVELVLQGVKSILVANRTVCRGIGLVQEFNKKFSKSKLSFISLSDLKKQRYLSETDLLINSTSLGMRGEEFYDLPLALLPSTCLVYDIIYSPLQTRLIEAAARRGLVAQNGLGMLLHQGGLSFQIWTQRKPPLKIMKEALTKILNSKSESRNDIE
jgi:shikimate dehydrogenase